MDKYYSNWLPFLLLFVSLEVYSQEIFNPNGLQKDIEPIHIAEKEKTAKPYKKWKIIDLHNIDDDSVKVYLNDTLFTKICVKYGCFSDDVFIFKGKQKVKNVFVTVVLTRRKRYIKFQTDFYDGTYIKINFFSNDSDYWRVQQNKIKRHPMLMHP